MNTTVEVDKIEVSDLFKIVQVRERICDYEENGIQIGPARYNRLVIEPGQDYSSFPESVRLICQSNHTEAVIKAFNDAL